jgi:KaiC/GvpD/RAD55 family RecA-like ATPase
VNDWIGEYPSEVLIGFFGEARAGKTIFLLQEAYYNLKEGNVLIIDTEFDKKEFIKVWDSRFRKRFGIDSGDVYVGTFSNMDELFKFIGMNVKFTVEKDGKITVNYIGNVKNDLEEMISKKKIKVVIVDSVTELFSTEFPGGLKNFPARKDAESLFFLNLLKLAYKHKLYMFGTHHVSLGLLRYAKPIMKGGSEIRHLFKLWFYLEHTQHTKTSLQGLRRIYLVRNFKHLDWSKEQMIILRDDGFHEISKEEVEKLKGLEAEEAV